MIKTCGAVKLSERFYRASCFCSLFRFDDVAETPAIDGPALLLLFFFFISLSLFSVFLFPFFSFFSFLRLYLCVWMSFFLFLFSIRQIYFYFSFSLWVLYLPVQSNVNEKFFFHFLFSVCRVVLRPYYGNMQKNMKRTKKNTLEEMSASSLMFA